MTTSGPCLRLPNVDALLRGAVYTPYAVQQFSLLKLADNLTHIGNTSAYMFAHY